MNSKKEIFRFVFVFLFPEMEITSIVAVPIVPISEFTLGQTWKKWDVSFNLQTVGHKNKKNLV